METIGIYQPKTGIWVWHGMTDQINKTLKIMGQTATKHLNVLNGGQNWIPQQLAGWWFQPTPEKYEFVSWDDDIPNIWKNKSHVPNHQPD